MIEPAFGAKRYAPNATLKLSLLEAHHDGKASTVLRNLTKKNPLYQNPSWENPFQQNLLAKTKTSNEPEKCRTPQIPTVQGGLA